MLPLTTEPAELHELATPRPGPEAKPIINGEDAEVEDWPQAGAIVPQVVGMAPAIMCSSTLIAPDVVLTAAHCVDEAYIGAFEALYWSRQADLRRYDGSTEPNAPPDAVVAADWIMHPDWSIDALGIGLAENHDIALVFLDEALTDIRLAVLASPEEDAEMESGDEVVIVGWGMTDPADPLSYGLKQQGVEAVAEIADYEFQVGEDGDSTRKCHGDSGGPTFRAYETDSTEIYRQLGVASHTYDENDCMTAGAVETRVNFYRDWVAEEMEARCDDDSRVWCDEPGILPAPPPIPLDVSDVTLVGCSAAPGSAVGGFVGGWLLVGRRRRCSDRG